MLPDTTLILDELTVWTELYTKDRDTKNRLFNVKLLMLFSADQLGYFLCTVSTLVTASRTLVPGLAGIYVTL